MSGVDFHEPSADSFKNRNVGSKDSALEKLLYTFGLAKDKKSAQRVLLIIAIIAIALTAIIILRMVTQTVEPAPQSAFEGML